MDAGLGFEALQMRVNIGGMRPNIPGVCEGAREMIVSLAMCACL